MSTKAKYDWKMREDVADVITDTSSTYNYCKSHDWVMPEILELFKKRPLYTVSKSKLRLHKEPTVVDIASRLNEDIKNEKTILVWGDYDVDGMTATVSLYLTLKSIQADVKYGVPNRLTSGYGIDIPTISHILAGRDPSKCTIVTVDNGIGEKDNVDKLKELGYTVYITDHHLPEGDLPDAPICNFKCNIPEDDDRYMLSGCCIAALISMELLERHHGSVPRDMEHLLYVLSSLSIVSDVIELKPTIRKWMNNGLVEIQTTQHPGLRALMDLCKLRDNQPISAQYLSYSVIPKINAAGRMGEPYKGIELLLLHDPKAIDKEVAYIKANDLFQLNVDRKNIEQKIYEQVEGMADEQINITPHSLVLYQPNWHLGVLGIIAARVAENYGVPTLVLSEKDGVIQGSGRSVGNFDLHSALGNCSTSLTNYGGHAAAAGVETTLELLPSLVKSFEQSVAEHMSDNPVELLIDQEVTPKLLSDVRYQIGLRWLEPHGNYNPVPIFLLKDVVVVSSDMRRETLNMVVRRDELNLVVTKFRPPDEFLVPMGVTIDIVISPSWLYFSGTTNIEWKIVDLEVKHV